MIDDFIERVHAANPERSSANLKRRLLKITEEAGEVAESYLNVSSPHNGKNKTWDDVREELIDTLIVVIDCALTPFEDGAPTPLLAGSLVHELTPLMTGPRITDHNLLVDEMLMLAKYAGFSAEALHGRHRAANFFARVSEAALLVGELCVMAFPDDDLAREHPLGILGVVSDLLDLKLAKWAAMRARMAVVTDDV